MSLSRRKFTKEVNLAAVQHLSFGRKPAWKVHHGVVAHK